MISRTPEQTQDRLQRLLALREAVEEEIRSVTGRNPYGTDAPCGTEQGYQQHRYRGEPRDERCRLAHAAHNRAKEAERRRQARREPEQQQWAS